jgi:predicted DNA-binding protein
MSKLFAVRMDESLIGELHNLRKLHGTVISHFVSEAVAEKLTEMKEDEEDIATIEARKDEKSISLEDFRKHLKSTGVDV